MMGTLFPSMCHTIISQHTTGIPLTTRYTRPAVSRALPTAPDPSRYSRVSESLQQAAANRNGCGGKHDNGPILQWSRNENEVLLGDVVVKSAKETTCNGTSSDQCKCISLYYRINSYNLLANNTCFHPHDDSHTRPDGDDGGYQEDPILLPQSTHSLLFTEPIGSIPFGYAFGIVILSLVSLLLALVNNLDAGTPGNPLGVPVQVDTSVRIAQYFAIIIGLLMEEEIPSSFYLLQMIPKYSLKRKL
ncbi:hypothetical protein HJC23_014072 [Cyclotella cryptica]|uniref:Uncharacterized protein n=1 Tax=Cyclotella cryptica TaxID=29204 RepID=A0ABD3QTH7_9STRA